MPEHVVLHSMTTGSRCASPISDWVLDLLDSSLSSVEVTRYSV